MSEWISLLCQDRHTNTNKWQKRKEKKKKISAKDIWQRPKWRWMIDVDIQEVASVSEVATSKCVGKKHDDNCKDVLHVFI